MKAWVGFALGILVGAALLEAAPTTSHSSVGFQRGRRYTYSFEGNITTGFTAEQKDGGRMQIEGKLIIEARDKNKIALWFEALRGRHTNKVGDDDDEDGQGYEHLFGMYTSQSEDYERELRKPILCSYYRGRVGKIVADKTDAQWSLNLKKFVLSHLQVQVKKPVSVNLETNEAYVSSGENVFEIYEDGVGGNCKTAYGVNDIDHMKVVNKIRLYDNCRSRVQHGMHNVEGCDCDECSLVRQPQDENTGKDEHNEQRGCHCSHPRSGSQEESYAISKYVVNATQSPYTIQDIKIDSKTVFRSHPKELATFVQIHCKFEGRAASAKLPQKPFEEAKKIDNLQPEFWNASAPNGIESEYFTLINSCANDSQIIHKIASDIHALAEAIVQGDLNETQDIGNTTLRVIDRIALLSYKQLGWLFTMIEAPRTGYPYDDDVDQVKRKLFIDALPLSGSTAAVMFIKDLIVNGTKVSSHEAKEMVEAMPDNVFNVTEEIVHEYEELCQSLREKKGEKQLFSSVCLAFAKLFQEKCKLAPPGKLVYSPYPECWNHQGDDDDDSSEEDCDEPPCPSSHERSTHLNETVKHLVHREMRRNPNFRFIVSHVKKVNQWLNHAENFHERVTYITSLGHMGSEYALHYLEPYITGTACGKQKVDKQECSILRRSAIYAMHKINFTSPCEVRVIISRVYQNVSEEPSVRIAAFGVWLSKSEPSESMLDEVVTRLAEEPSHQVKSFVVSSLKDIATSSLPHYREMAQKVRRALLRAPRIFPRVQDTYTVRSDFYDEFNEIGALLSGKIFRNHTGGYSEAEYLSLKYVAGHISNTLLRLAFDSEGFGPAMEKIGAVNQGYLSPYGYKNLDIIKILESVDDFKLLFYSDVFHKASVDTLDKVELITRLRDVAKLLAGQSVDRGQKCFVKLYMPTSFRRVVPSEAGLPVVMSHRTPLIIALMVDDLKVHTYGDRTLRPPRVNITASVHPSVYYSSITTMKVVTQAEDIHLGTEFENSIQVSLPMELGIEFNRKTNNVSLKVIPSMNRTILVHRQEARSFTCTPKEENSQQIRVLPEPLQFNGTIGSELFGVNITYNSTGEDLYAEQPFYYSKTAKKHGIVPALLEKWLYPQHLNNEYTVDLYENNETHTRGFVIDVGYQVEARENKSAKEGTSWRRYDKSWNIDADDWLDRTRQKWEDHIRRERQYRIHTLHLNVNTLGPHPTENVDEVVYSHTSDYRKHYLRVKSQTKKPEQGDFEPEACSEAVVFLPSIEESYSLDNPEESLFVGKLGFGQSCESADNLVVKGMLKLEEQPTTRGRQPYKEETEECLQAVRHGRYDPTSCWTSLLNETNVSELQMEVSYQNLPKELVNVSQCIDKAIKHKYHPDEIKRHGPAGHIKVEGSFTERVEGVKDVDVVIQKPEETLHIKYLAYDDPELEKNPWEKTIQKTKGRHPTVPPYPYRRHSSSSIPVKHLYGHPGYGYPKSGVVPQKKVVCLFNGDHLPDIVEYPPEYINYTLCTHIHYGFAVLDEVSLQIKPYNESKDVGQGYYLRTTNLKEHKPDLKVLLTVGGWSDSGGDKYSQMIGHNATRERFISSAVQMLQRFNFDGLDIAWQFPGCPQGDCSQGNRDDKKNFAILLREMKETFDQRGLILTAQISPNTTVIDEAYDVQALTENLQYINLMTQDYLNGTSGWDVTNLTAPLVPLMRKHEYLHSCIRDTVGYLYSKGIPKEQMVVGGPSYGRTFQLVDPNKNGLGAPVQGPGPASPYTYTKGTITYMEICTGLKKDPQGWIKVELGDSGQYIYSGYTWITYDSPQYIRIKADYVKEYGLGGMMLWSLEGDDYHGRCCGLKSPLLNAMAHTLNGVGEYPSEPCQ